MKKICTIVCFLLIISLCACAQDKESNDESQESKLAQSSDTASGNIEQQIHNAAKNCISIEVGEVEMQNETEGRAKIVVTLPDFSQLFIKMTNEGDQYKEKFLSALLKGDYDIKQVPGYAEVTIENGEMFIRSDEAKKLILEQELINAITAATETAK